MIPTPLAVPINPVLSVEFRGCCQEIVCKRLSFSYLQLIFENSFRFQSPHLVKMEAENFSHFQMSNVFKNNQTTLSISIINRISYFDENTKNLLIIINEILLGHHNSQNGKLGEFPVFGDKQKSVTCPRTCYKRRLPKYNVTPPAVYSTGDQHFC